MVGEDIRSGTQLEEDRSLRIFEVEAKQGPRTLKDRGARTLEELTALLRPGETQLRRTQANILTQLTFTTVGWGSAFLAWQALRCIPQYLQLPPANIGFGGLS